ncbi:MAG: hypothetical protein KBI47_00080 [Armatimonadetes bacterium]|nr:hypothetical protein [Armatimonadota bacterium]
MRHRLIIAAILLTIPVLLIGCKEEPEPEAAAPPPPDPGWPSYSPMAAAIEFELQEAHYHIRKGRYMAPDSYGSEAEMPAAMGYTQWAFANATRLYESPQSAADDKQKLEIETKRNSLFAGATDAADHLILEHGGHFSVPHGYVPRCKWCGLPMPKSLMRWPMEDGEKHVECPRCGARDSFPTGLIYHCPNCHDVMAGTQLGPRCPTCSRGWAGSEKHCSRCGYATSVLSRQGQRCPKCGAKWNFDVPFGNWPARAPTPVDFTGSGEGDQCTAYTAVTGRRCPNKLHAHGKDKTDLACWYHRGQKQRDEVAASGGGAPATAGGAGAAGGMGGGMGGPGGPPGMGGPGGPPGMGGPGGPPGMGGPGGPPAMGGPGGPPADMAPGGAGGPPGGAAAGPPPGDMGGAE